MIDKLHEEEAELTEKLRRASGAEQCIPLDNRLTKVRELIAAHSNPCPYKTSLCNCTHPQRNISVIAVPCIEPNDTCTLQEDDKPVPVLSGSVRPKPIAPPPPAPKGVG